MNPPINFIHIPKTAGTSFRNALEKKYGFDRILRDYTPRAVETSKKVHELVYKKQDLYLLKLLLNNNKYAAISGHYYAEKYSNILSVSQCIAFVREPVSRLISEYQHFIRHADYQKSLIDFASEKRNVNKQSKYLKGIPYAAYGLIGITEYYNESIAIFNEDFNENIPALYTNKAPENNLNRGFDLDKEELQHIRDINSEDILLYEKLVLMHKTRMDYFKGHKKYTFGGFQVHGSNIEGWAYQIKTEKPVIIEIVVNRVVIDEVIANQFCENLALLKCPRAGYLGFSYSLINEVYKSDIVCRVKDSKQSLLLY